MPTPIIIIGTVYGIITGMLLSMLLWTLLISRRNLSSTSKKQNLPYYSTRGLEIFDKNMTDSFFSTPTLNLKNDKKEDRVVKEMQERLEYFKRNRI